MRPPARLLSPLVALVSALVLGACGDGGEDPAAPPPDVEPVATNDLVAAATDEGLTTLVALADSAGLLGTLRGEGPYTVFAPTNEAFAALPQALRDSLMLPAHRPRLARLLRYHVVEGRIGTDVPLPMTITTLGGDDLSFESDADGFLVRDGGGAAVRVVTPDVNVSNGVVHVLGSVLTPPDSMGGGQ